MMINKMLVCTFLLLFSLHIHAQDQYRYSRRIIVEHAICGVKNVE